MQKKNKLWQAFLAVSVAALTVPAFVQGGSDSTESSSPSATSPAGSASAETASKDEAKTDADRALNQSIRSALSADMTLASSVQSVQLKTEEGEVKLEGEVFNKDAKEMIEEKVKKVSGVKDVENDLKVASSTGSSTSGSMGSSSGSSGLSGSGSSSGIGNR